MYYGKYIYYYLYKIYSNSVVHRACKVPPRKILQIRSNLTILLIRIDYSRVLHNGSPSSVP